MADNFPPFAKLVASSFQDIVKNPNVFVVGVDGDALFAAYLAAFPEGTNPIFKKRPEHDCSCCRQFIRRAGSVVSMDENGAITTVWDVAAKKAEYPYDVVATALRDLVKAAVVTDIFRVGSSEGSFGNLKTHSQGDGGFVITWNHLYTGEIPKALRSPTPDKLRGDYRITVQVFERGLLEFHPDAVATVLSLIEAKNLYRGEEFMTAVTQFQEAQSTYRAKTPAERQAFVWSAAHGPASRFRNTAIGTLVQDLSEGKPVEVAVKLFESKVAPSNYKRTTAVITPMMVKKAMETIALLDLEGALERRFARLDDISVRDVLWVDKAIEPMMKGGGLGDMLMQHAKAQTKDVSKDEEKAEPIDMDDFVKKVLPEATSMELLLRGTHVGNLMSLTAPMASETKHLFKWDNDFAWSYNGNITDSELRKAVQSRGGRVDGVFRFSHQWNYDKRNTSLMDLHVFMPGNEMTTPKYERNCINDQYGNNQRVGWNHRGHNVSGGVQDVDYVQQAPVGYIPVENITFPDLKRMPEGTYVCKVHNWQLRHPTEGGFRAEIEFAGQVFAYEVDRPLKNKEWVAVATVTLKNGAFTIEHHLPVGISSQQKWGLQTESYIKVNAVTLSPNYWGDNAVGNKHTFFVLDGAKNDEPTRGIYNEFLHSRLEEHRKVFEVIGDKTKCQPTDGQLSGIGFSSTKADNVVVKVKLGKAQRLFNVFIGAR